MTLTAEQLSRLYRLLDEVLDLDEAGRRRWLESLAPEDADLRPTLESTLFRADAVGLTLPKFQLPTTAFRPGQTIGPYELIRQLGRGGMAEVWLAKRADGSLKREVAIKIPSAMHLRGDVAARFEREKDILSALEHPHIARLYDAGIGQDGLPFLAMEYVNGKPITSWSDSRRLDTRERIALFLQVLEAVEFAHSKGVLHRDIKPSNVLVTEEGQVRLLDFGVARLLERGDTQLTQVYGRALTPEYASPEQLNDGDPGPASDVYSLGVLLYELLAGTLPRKADAASPLQDPPAPAKPSTLIDPQSAQVRAGTPERISRLLKGDLDAIVLKAMAAEPGQRYATAKVFMQDLRAYLEGRSVLALPSTATSRLAKLLKREPIAALATLGIMVAAAALGYALLRAPGPQEAAPPAPIAGAPSDRSLAVLPFVDMSEHHDQEYFSDGLTEQLLDQLAKTPGLKVIARTSSFYFKGRQVPLTEIADALHVANLLEGSVRRSGNRLRVTTQLVRAQSGEHLWSETYDREVKDVFKVQDDITAAVVRALKAKLAAGAEAVNVSGTTNPEAYTAYLQGRRFYDQGNAIGYQNSVRAFREALALDPRYADAQAELAFSEARLADQLGDAAGLRQAIADAERAVQIGPDRGQPYSVRGAIRANWVWDWTGALKDFGKALSLDPDDSFTQMQYGNLLECLVRYDDALVALRRAADLDPVSAAVLDSIGSVSMSKGDLAGAREALSKAIALEPEDEYSRSNLGYAELLLGRPADARRTFELISYFKGLKLAGIAIVEHTLGHAEESRRALDDLIAEHAAGSAFQIAEVYAWRNERDQAFDWLERAFRQHDGGLAELKIDPLLASLRSDARYAALVRRMNFPP